MIGSRSEQKKLGKYTVLRLLGRGGAGVVYECLDPDLDRSVAIKTLLPAADAEGQEHLERFRGEAQALARMAHPNIVRIYDYDDRSEDFPFIVMEFVEGGSLRQWLTPDRPMPPSQAARLVSQVLAGLTATHGIGIVHRDIKPGNILMRGDLPLLADFGIARTVDKRGTMAGTLTGTAHYVAPEQLLGAEIDHRADIWSTGVLLYQMLTGRQPFDGANALAILDAIRNTNPIPPSEHCLPGVISGVLDQVVLKALAKRPEDRYASAEDFARALEHAMQAPSEIETTVVLTPAHSTSTPASQPEARAVRPRWAVVGGGAIVLAGVGLTIWLLGLTPGSMPTKPPDAPPTTVVQAEQARSTMPFASPSDAPAGNTAPGVAAVQPEGDAPVGGGSVGNGRVAMPASRPSPSSAPRLEDLRAMVAASDCAVIGGTLEPDRMILSGLGATDVVTPLRDLWTSLHDAVPAGGVARFDVAALARVGGLCEALELVRPFAAPSGSGQRPVSIQLRAERARLHPDMAFSLAVGMPDFGGWIQVDYFSFAENAVLHVGLSSPRLSRQPTQLPQAIQLNANESALVFNGTTGSPGEDLVIAIASRDRLFDRPRPEIEDVRTYLAALRTALEGRPAGSVEVHAVPVIIHTQP